MHMVTIVCPETLLGAGAADQQFSKFLFALKIYIHADYSRATAKDVELGPMWSTLSWKPLHKTLNYCGEK